jgi:6,7-dimethyl-8-ribityllumazine synthase
MSTQFQGNPKTVIDEKNRFAIVVARFNESITSRLLDGAVQTLQAHGVADERIDVAWTPGAFEIPTVANHFAATGRYAAVICLGAVIRGETTHDQHINRAVSTALCEIGVHYGLPVLFGILTCNTLEQAVARSGGQTATTGKDGQDVRLGNKGVDCALAALEMVDLMRKLPASL